MNNARQFNVRDHAGNLLCPACGFPGYALEEAYDARGGLAGVTICPCCMWEPGFDDDVLASPAAKDTILGSLRAARAGWNDLAQWKGTAAEKPANWDGARQLSQLFEIAPNVR